MPHVSRRFFNRNEVDLIIDPKFHIPTAEQGTVNAIHIVVRRWSRIESKHFFDHFLVARGQGEKISACGIADDHLTARRGFVSISTSSIRQRLGVSEIWLHIIHGSAINQIYPSKKQSRPLRRGFDAIVSTQ